MIYIASPYSHKDKNVVEYRVKSVAQYSAKLLINKQPSISPITVGTTILKYANLPSDFEFWKQFSLDLLAVCTEIHVLMLDGWRESIGVLAEIEFAIENNIKLTYIEHDPCKRNSN